MQVMRVGPVVKALLSAALFGAAAPASKRLLAELSPFVLAGVLYLGAALAVAPLALHGRPAARWSRRSIGRLAGAIVCGGMLGPLLVLFALQHAPAASVSLWLNFELVATAVVGHLLFHDHLERGTWWALAGMVLAGSWLCVGAPPATVQSALLAVLACLCWGLDNHWTALIDGLTPAQSTFFKGLVAGTVNLTIGGLQAGAISPLPALAAGLVVGGLSYGASIALYVAAAQQIGATRGQMIFASAPFIGLALSALVLGEVLTPAQISAAVLFLVSVAALFGGRHAHEHAHPALSHVHAHRHDDEHHAHAHEDVAPWHEHTHWHEHEPLVHSHPHWPDLHHRHPHRT